MAKNKVSDYSNVPSNNTDIGDINIAEGCAPSNINNAIRELMAQLKDMQTGADSDNFVVGGALTCTGAAVFSSTVGVTGAVTLSTALGISSGGTNLTTYAAGDLLYASATNVLAKLPTAATTTSVLLSGNTAPTWGKVALASAVSGTLPIANGGTGATTATSAINALLPTQTSNADKFLKTDGTNVSWAAVAVSGGTVTSVASGNGMNFTTITGSGTVTLGTPSTLTTSSTNAVTATSHTHAVTFPNTITSVNGVTTGAVTTLTLGSVQTASGSSTTLSSTIPSTARRITIMVENLSTSGTSGIVIRIGSGGIDTTGYLGTGGVGGTNWDGTANATNGFFIRATAAARIVHGSMTLTYLNNNIWVASGVFAGSENNYVYVSAGSKSLSGALSHVSIATSNGTDTFDGGTANILYE